MILNKYSMRFPKKQALFSFSFAQKTAEHEVLLGQIDMF